MTPENFCYWLQGYFEVTGPGEAGLTPQQTAVVREHLDLVFRKVTGEKVAQAQERPLPKRIADALTQGVQIGQVGRGPEGISYC